MAGDSLTNVDPRLRRFWHPVARADDLAAGEVRRVELLGEALVLSRTGPGDEVMQFVDNFCDIAHFPFVHAGTFGADEDELVGDLDVERVAADAVVFRHEHTVANREDPLVATGEHPLIQPRRMVYSWTAPFTCRLAIDLPLTGVHNTIITVVAPTTRHTTTLYTALVRNDITSADEPAALHAIEYEMSVLQQDLAILEHLADDSFPLDLRAQVHTRADRFTLEIRRALVEVLGS